MSASASARVLFCSFCGKSEHAVEKLIAGRSACICNTCAGFVNEMCGASSPSLRLSVLDRALTACPTDPAHAHEVAALFLKFVTGDA